MYHLATYSRNEKLSFGQKYFMHRTILDALEYCKKKGLQLNDFVEYASDLEEGIVDFLAISNITKEAENIAANNFKRGEEEGDMLKYLDDNPILRGISASFNLRGYIRERAVMASILTTVYCSSDEKDLIKQTRFEEVNSIYSKQLPSSIENSLSDNQDRTFFEDGKKYFGKPLLMVFSEELKRAKSEINYKPRVIETEVE